MVQVLPASAPPVELLAQVRRLLVLDGVATATPLRELIALLEAQAVGVDPGEAFGQLYRALVEHALEAGWTVGAGDSHLLPAALADAALTASTTLSRWVERTTAMQRPLPAPILEAAAADLRTLQALALLDLAGVPGTVPLPYVDLGSAQRSAPLLRRLMAAPDWSALAPALVDSYAIHGAGLFAQFRAFRWTANTRAAGAMLEGQAEERDFAPVLTPDAIRPSQLVAYEAERALLRRVTAQFLAGYPGNNVLLYGDRGTGKSSSVKALLNEQPREGEPADLWERLRIVEVPKAHLADFPLLAARLREKPQRFIVFVDDLSFEEGETQYKDMKAMLEGGLEARPANVVVYATSNRRHLIREQFSDRPTPGNDDVHARDTVEEKLSFADRFGVTITFPSPDQARYLQIVEGLAQQRGLLAGSSDEGRKTKDERRRVQGAIERGALRARAIEWAQWHNGRSGRTARQFVDYLEGELGQQDEGRRTKDE